MEFSHDHLAERQELEQPWLGVAKFAIVYVADRRRRTSPSPYIDASLPL
jgi:hypothetical protein